MKGENLEIIKSLKEISLYDFIMSYIYGNEKKGNISSVVYTAKELQNLYPKLFSKYKLDQAIKNEKLPYFRSGRERYFLKDDIEKWIKTRNYLG